MTVPDPATYRALVEMIAERGYPPTRRELAARLGLSVAATQKRVVDLVECGWIEVDPISSRGIRIAMKTEPEMM
jgi:DNA-binding IclR family transcriptional regulator